MIKQLIQVALLDDFQNVALKMADWSVLDSRIQVTVFNDHLAAPVEVVKRLKPFAVLCVMRERTPLTKEVLSQLPNLKLIVSTGQRNASIDLEAATEFGIIVCGTRYITNGAPELTWGFVMGLSRNLFNEYRSLKAGGWQISIGKELRGKTIGIVGLGNIGGMVAKYARAFDMNIISWSQNLTPEKAENHGAMMVTKEELFSSADFITLHLVLSNRTKGIIGSRELGLMKPAAYIINTSRGPLIEEAALIDVLKNRKIAGAALDVFDEEPLPPSHPFRSLDNLLATPHIGFVTDTAYKIFYEDTVEDIAAWLGGNPVRKMN